ncbi:hypothetical protein, partial [Saccharothrix longispora]|uniref:hypothetical protein n=1 Tax=Saccharothrix longispora TaxID=33920 RepID=UPI0028FDAF12
SPARHPEVTPASAGVRLSEQDRLEWTRLGELRPTCGKTSQPVGVAGITNHARALGRTHPDLLTMRS